MGFKPGNSAAHAASTSNTAADLVATQASWPTSTSKRSAAHKNKKHENSSASITSTPFEFGSPAHGTRTKDDETHQEHDMIDIQMNGGHCKASIAALKMASPILRGELEAFNPGQIGREVMCLKGSDKAITIFLAILHYRFAEVPATLDLSELFEVACLVASYKCAYIIRPWVATWVNACKSDVTNADAHKALWIAYSLGDNIWYKEMLQMMTLHAKRHQDSAQKEGADKNYVLCNGEGTNFKDMVLPEEALDIIAEIRNIQVISILEAVSMPFKQVSAQHRESQHKFCRVSKDQEQCEDLLVGSAFKQLARRGLMPVPKAEDYHESIRTLTDQVKSLKLSRLVMQGNAPHQSHEGCNLGMNAAVDEIMADLPVVLTGNHEEHIRLQGVATGLAASAIDKKTNIQADDASPKRQTRYDTLTYSSDAPSVTSSTD